ncbi:type VII secretion protein EccC [Bifidobacterium cuniculi]|uniref:DNA segregation ATPase-like protein n=1 Tax=Bifidobacterium cuniculi TaxID=1688 RepID=A0A087AYP4_9BIFI|nr:type VII secretion protein EccC [Bifidobacterium cuniculi]KFI63894.1 DNA segregation ATPase-like protein [Bifidobacterium cuniculi]
MASEERNSRLDAPRVPKGKIVMQAPPTLEASDGVSTLLTSLVPLLGSVSAIVMMLMTNSGLTGLLTGGMFMISSMGFVVVNGVRQRAQRMANLTASRNDYLTYLSGLRTRIRSAGHQQRNAALWNAPDPQALLTLAQEPERRWERMPSDDDFLSVRLGTQDQPLGITLQAPDVAPLAELDPVSASAAHRFMMAHETLHHMPYSVNLAAYKRVEVLGALPQAQALVRAMLAQAVTWHGPEVLRVCVLAAPDRVDQWEWVTALPHAQAEDGQGNAMVVTGMHEVDDAVGGEVTERGRFTGNRYEVGPHVLVVNDGFDRVSLAQQTRLFTEHGLEGVTVIDMPASWEDLEEDHVLRVLFEDSTEEVGLNVLQEEPRRILEVYSTVMKKKTAEPDSLTLRECVALAERLSVADTAIEDDSQSAQGSSRKRSSELPDLLGIQDIRHIDFNRLWTYHTGSERLNVPIGLHDDLTVAKLDIKEMSQHGMGPHGVLVGATGSGKSEVLRTLVLSLALTHSPDQLNFVLIDFKGGATFAGMDGMPHISSIITNLGREASLVDRMEDALDGEINRRQELLRDAGNIANITDYEDARVNKGRDDLEPLPALVIVVDEFSELLKAKEDIVQTFVRVGAVGRSLGIHLLIASQRLEQGKLRGLDEHLSYRVGLKTFSASESRAVLGVPDAFELPSLPGIGFLKTPGGTMSRFRASYVSGVPAALEATGAQTTTFQYAVEQMRGKGRPAHAVWLPPLVTPNTLDEFMPDLQVVPGLGLVSPTWRKAGTLMAPCMLEDRPREQKRDVHALDLSGAGGHVAVVGGPLSGKSMMLRTIVTSLALSHSPLETQFFVVDCGGGTFTGLEPLVHVAGVAGGNEEEKVRRTIAEVSGVIDRRERFFKEQGIDGMDTYRRRRAQGTVDDGYGDVFLVIDGWGNFRADYEELEGKVQQIAARGLAFGVHVMLGANRWMEIRANIADLVGTRVELRLGDPDDSRLDRPLAKMVPAGMPGRGISQNKLHIMGALPRIDGDDDATTVSDGVADLVAKVNAAWDGPQPPKLRLLPTMLEYAPFAASLPPRGTAGAPKRGELVLGVNEDSLAPVTFDMNAVPHCYLLGDSKSGKSSFLRLVAQEVCASYAPSEAKIFMVDYRRANLAQVPQSHMGDYMTNAEMASATFRELAEYLQTRLPGPDVTPEQLRNRSWWTGAEVYVLVDDYDLVAPKSGANPLLPIVPYLAQAADIGLHVVVARRAGGASRAMYEPVLQAFQDLGMTGILLDGDPNEGQLIGRVKPKRAVPGRAQVVTRDAGLFVAQFAYPAVVE